MTQSLQELEQDIEQSRAKLDLTIDRLQGKMSVSGVVDDMLGTARNGRYAPVFDNVLLTIRRNPVPIMLMAAGLGLLVHRLGRTLPMVRREPRLTADEDIVAEAEDIRVYGSGASSLQPAESSLARSRSANTRI
jgi:Protein of unknown function (DUF3618)